MGAFHVKSSSIFQICNPPSQIFLKFSPVVHIHKTRRNPNFQLDIFTGSRITGGKSLAQNACRTSLKKGCRVLCYCKNVFSEEIMVRRTWNYAFLFILRCWIHLTHLQTMKKTLNWSNHTIIKIFQIKFILD